MRAKLTGIVLIVLSCGCQSTKESPGGGERPPQGKVSILTQAQKQMVLQQNERRVEDVVRALNVVAREWVQDSQDTRKLFESLDQEINLECLDVCKVTQKGDKK